MAQPCSSPGRARCCQGALATEPVGDGLVASMARPGANLTGLTLSVGYQLAGKRAEALAEEHQAGTFPRLVMQGSTGFNSNEARRKVLEERQDVTTSMPRNAARRVPWEK